MPIYVRHLAALRNKRKERFKLKSLDAITKRMTRIRERMHLEEIFGISPANEEVFLAICQRFERTLTNADLDADEILRDAAPLHWAQTELSNGNNSPKIYWKSFDDWRNFAPVRQTQKES
jgi:hypothetical protein